MHYYYSDLTSDEVDQGIGPEEESFIQDFVQTLDDQQQGRYYIMAFYV